MKAMILVLSPEECAKLLNGDLSILVRKKFPKDYVGWVYIYCTKNGGKPYDGLVWDSEGKGLVNSKLFPYAKNCPEHNRLINSKVVARFWCDKVEEILYDLGDKEWFTDSCTEEKDLLKESCLEQYELDAYLGGKSGRAVHIQKLEIFDKPKDISEFYVRFPKADKKFKGVKGKMLAMKPLTRAPQSWCYVEM